MSYTEIVEPSYIENTTILKVFTDEGVHRNYRITPNDGYAMHDKILDEQDEETNKLCLGFRLSTASVGADYDFFVNEREFYTHTKNYVTIY